MYKIEFKCDECGHEECQVKVQMNYHPVDNREVESTTVFLECKKCSKDEDICTNEA